MGSQPGVTGGKGRAHNPRKQQKIRLQPERKNAFAKPSGGSGGIRTHGGVPPTLVFKTRALNHSATLPFRTGFAGPCRSEYAGRIDSERRSQANSADREAKCKVPPFPRSPQPCMLWQKAGGHTWGGGGQSLRATFQYHGQDRRKARRQARRFRPCDFEGGTWHEWDSVRLFSAWRQPGC